MKRIVVLASLLAVLGGSATAADASTKLSNVHLCCNSCVKGVDKAVSGVPGATAKSDKEASTVTLSAPDQVTVQKVAGAKGNTAAKGAELFEVTGDFKAKAVFTALNKAGLSGKVAN